jgi:hypothetical protein
VSEPVLSPRALLRALLARQLLLERAHLSIPDALEQVGGLQTQYAPSGYVGLWSRLADFERDDLTRELECRRVIQATLMRVTIHLVSAAEFWCYALGVRRARREWWRRTTPGAPDADEVERSADVLRVALADGPRWVSELGEEARGFVGTVSVWVDLVRVPPSGTWERRRADRLALAEGWVGPESTTEAEGVRHLVRAYLRGFGPASFAHISRWAGVPVTALRAAAGDLELRRFRDEDGKPLIDLPYAPLPDPDTPAPVRLLPHWDANLLVHARRTGILPQAYRERVFTTRNPFSIGTYLVDGSVAGAWSHREGRIVLEPYRELQGAVRDEVHEEAARLEAFHR